MTDHDKTREALERIANYRANLYGSDDFFALKNIAREALAASAPSQAGAEPAGYLYGNSYYEATNPRTTDHIRQHGKPLYTASPAGAAAVPDGPLTNEQCDAAIRSSGLWSLACVAPSNLAMLRGLCRAAHAPAAAAPQAQAGAVVGWLYEETLPDGYPYEAMFEHSAIHDGVRMFPVYAPVEAVGAQRAEVPTMDDAIAAGDGTLHGAIDHWQTRALNAEAKLAAQDRRRAEVWGLTPIECTDLYKSMQGRRGGMSMVDAMQSAIAKFCEVNAITPPAATTTNSEGDPTKDT